MGFLEKIFGDWNSRELKKIEKIADAVEALDQGMQALSDEELRGKTEEFKERLAGGETLDDILPDAFAVVREADWRVLEKRPFRVQLLGGIDSVDADTHELVLDGESPVVAIAGNISDGTKGGRVNVTKKGSGTWRLSRANDFTTAPCSSSNDRVKPTSPVAPSGTSTSAFTASWRSG